MLIFSHYINVRALSPVWHITRTHTYKELKDTVKIVVLDVNKSDFLMD